MVYARNLVLNSPYIETGRLAYHDNRQVLMMKSFVRSFWTIALLALHSAIALADSGFQAVYKPTLDVKKITQAIKIDGDLSDPGWKEASRTDQFVENDPGNQIAPSVKSAVMIGYDDANLYLAFIAWDDPAKVRASWSERDNIWRDDYFGIMLDTYGDRASGYEIFVNPLGIQGDERVTNSFGQEDESYDMIYYSRGKVTDSGYQVELSIPFTSLRFPAKDEQTWAAQFWRDRQRDTRYRYSWAAVNRDDPCWVCQWGNLTGIRGIKPGRNLSILPNVVATQAGAMNNRSDPHSPFDNADPKAEVSVSGKYAPTSNSTVEITVNPDFSQVESDAGQIDVNSTFALYYPERRPFFQEGSDLWNTPITAIYTRSVNDPQVAGKAIAKFGHTSVLYTIARDNHSPILVPFVEENGDALAGKSTSNLFRMKYATGNGSYASVLATDRRLDGGGSGSLGGVDGGLLFLKNYEIDFQGLLSHTKEPYDTTTHSFDTIIFGRDRYTGRFDSESFSGHAMLASFQRNADFWSFNLGFERYSPTFRTDNGFVTSNDYQGLSFWTGLNFRRAKGLFLVVNPQISLSATMPFDESFIPLRLGKTRQAVARPSLYMRLRGSTEVNLWYQNAREIFHQQTFLGRRGSVQVDSRFSRRMSGGFTLMYGRALARTVDPPQMGHLTEVSLNMFLRPTDRLKIEPTFAFSRMNHLDSYMSEHPDSNRRIFSGYILRVRNNFQFTRELNVRLVVQFNDFSDRLDFEPLITYQLNPFTIFYFGSNNRYQYFLSDTSNNWPDSRWKLSSRQFFAKLQYLFRV